MTRHDVFVIGGGVSGLAAAVRVVAAGGTVALFEARGTCGGRAASFDDRHGGVVDNGQHALMGCYHETLALLETIGSRDLVEVPRALSVAVVDEAGVRSTLTCPPWSSPWQALAGVARWSAVPLRDRAVLVHVAPALWAARVAEATGRGELPVRDGETVRAWLNRHRQGPILTALLWEPLAVAALNQGIDEADARPFVRVLGRIFGPGRLDASIALATTSLAEVFAGPARRFLERCGTTVSCHALAKVRIDGQGASAIELRGREAISLAGRPVIVAVPWHSLESTLTGDTNALAPLLTAARATRAAAIVTVNLWFDRPVLDVPMLGLARRTFQWAFARDGYVALVSSGAGAIVRESNEHLSARALADLVECVPACRGVVPVRSLVLREPRATFSLAPGQPTRPGVVTAVSNLLLAGDWVDTGLPATIEGAVVAGFRAADAARRLAASALDR